MIDRKENEHQQLRDALRSRVVQIRRDRGESLLKEFRFYQYYMDLRTFETDFPTSDLRMRYIRQVLEEEAQLEEGRLALEQASLPLFVLGPRYGLADAEDQS